MTHKTADKDAAAASASSRIFTVAPGEPFLDTVARAICSGQLPAHGGTPPSPLDLPNLTLVLPTPRATRAMQDAFLRVSDGQALMLPRIIAITDGDEDGTLLAQLAQITGLGDHAQLSLPPAINDVARKVALTKLVLAWSTAKSQRADAQPEPASLSDEAVAARQTPAQAAGLAGELAALMDIVEREGASLSGLADLVPDNFSKHWQETLEFLQIVTDHWPQYLREQNLTSSVARRNATILAEADRLRTTPPDHPVIIAGVTGSVPATAELMSAVAALPNGAIVLPGLDQHLDDASWQAIKPVYLQDELPEQGPQTTTIGHPEHPQYGLGALLNTLAINRADVTVLAADNASPVKRARQKFMSEVLRPASTTKAWQGLDASVSQEELEGALSDVHLVETPNAQDEAEAIALIMREVAETPGRTAALVSPDRLLARRVGVRLEAWGIRVDDSAGRPFIKTAPGVFLDLVAAAIASRFAPTDVIALLKHPLTRLSLDPFTIRKTARALEIAAFRTAYLGRGLSGLADALERARLDVDAKRRRHFAVRRIYDDDWDNAHLIVERLKTAYAPLEALYAKPNDAPLQDFVRAHLETAEALAKLDHDDANEETTVGEKPSPVWNGAAGEQGSVFFANLLADTMPDLSVPSSDYHDLYRNLLSGLNIRERQPVHPRLSIWGLFESRLQQPDVVILGALNEGIWPKTTDPGPWLNRAMRQALKLPSPEEDIGREALDLVNLTGADTVYLTRSEKRGGDPQVPSRWLLRLQAVLDGLRSSDLIIPDKPWAAWARQRDKVDSIDAIAPPQPRPPLALRPRKLSVSSIETWIKNPYAVYARQILNLEKLPPLGKEPGADLRGTIIHEALARFSKEYPIGHQALTSPEAVREAFIAQANSVIADYRAHPRIAAFWIPRIERFAAWFAETELKRRTDVKRSIAESTGELVIDAPHGPFTVSARADRIDVNDDGLIITDYKTGRPPNQKAVTSGTAPQLALEAAIAMFGTNFDRVGDVSSVTGLRFISASGGTPPGEQTDLHINNIADVAHAAADGLSDLVAKYDDPGTAYSAVRRQKFDYRYEDYDHLARVSEWSGRSQGGGDS